MEEVSDRLTFSASVAVRAEAEEVFTLVSDLRRKARLNPNIQVIGVELEGGEPLREGSVFHHKFRKGGRVLAYRTRCIRMVPPRLFETRSETEPPFEVRVSVEPTLEGCRLTQQETLEVGPELLDALEPGHPMEQAFRDALSLLSVLPGLRLFPAEWRAQQRDRLARRLTGELQAWLNAIKAQLEARQAGQA